MNLLPSGGQRGGDREVQGGDALDHGAGHQLQEGAGQGQVRRHPGGALLHVVPPPQYIDIMLHIYIYV